MTDTAGRLLRLLPLLTARPSWRGDELAARLGVTTRTVRRDIDRLRELGYMVHAIPGRRGGYALGPGGTRLPPLLLDEDSAVAVALGLRAAAADPALRGSQEAAARAAAVIDQVLPPRLRRRVEALTVTTVPLVPAEPSIEPNDLALIALACQQEERLRFGYRNGSGQDSRRHVEPFRLVYSVREPGALLYADELARRERAGDGLEVRYVYTRTAPPGSGQPTGRINAALIASAGWPPERSPAVFVCGPTGFVEAAANLLVRAGHAPGAIKTERFGPSGGQP